MVASVVISILFEAPYEKVNITIIIVGHGNIVLFIRSNRSVNSRI